MRRYIVSLVVLVAVCLLAAAPALSYSQASALDGIASWLAMRPVEIRCLTKEESEQDSYIAAYGAAAYVLGEEDERGWHPVNYAVFSYGHCEPLLAYLSGDASAWTLDDVAWAILVLTHESGHLRGHRWSASEAQTQCWAMRHYRYVAQRLGVTDPAILSLMVRRALYWHSRMPTEYQLRGCALPVA